MKVTLSVEKLFNAQGSIRSLLEKTEKPIEGKDISFEIVYWLTKLVSATEIAMKVPQEELQKLNTKYGITMENAKKPLAEILGDKMDEFITKRAVILTDKVDVEINEIEVKLFDGTGIGAVTLMGILPFLKE